MLLTYNEHEFAAVRAAFWLSQALPPTLGTGDLLVDDLGSLIGWRVLHAHSRQGNRQSQRTAATLAPAYYPHAIISVGIAFGVEEGKQHIGDVLVSRFIVDYELARVSRSSITLRGSDAPASRALVHGLEQLHIRSKHVPRWPTLHFGGVLSGEKLVDSLDYRNDLVALANQDDIIGGEMEAAGLFTALEGSNTHWVVVKAICDFADGMKNNAQKDQHQKDAASNAAAVVHALLASPAYYPCPDPILLQTTPLLVPTALVYKDDPRAFTVPGQKSHAVWLNNLQLSDLDKYSDEHPDQHRNAPQVVAFDHLLQWLSEPTSPPLYALLGEYGMGKTTHCQVLARHLQEQRAKGATTTAALYFDLRKVETLAAQGSAAGGLGHVATLQETITDCLRNGYLHVSGQAPTYTDVLDIIDSGALVIFDGLDEVLSRIADAQGLRFTANLLKVIPEAKARQTAQGRGADALRLPKVLLSCRTQFFRNLSEQNSHLTGEHRGGADASQYAASVLQPFTDEQIRAYLQAALPGQNVDDLMQLIAGVHNLRELAGRPFTLGLVAQFVPRIQSWQAQRKTITNATLYREVAREWLLRDKEKQSFQPEQKEQLASDLAAHMWRNKQRGMRAIELEAWLGAWAAEGTSAAN